MKQLTSIQPVKIEILMKMKPQAFAFIMLAALFGIFRLLWRN